MRDKARSPLEKHMGNLVRHLPWLALLLIASPTMASAAGPGTPALELVADSAAKPSAAASQTSVPDGAAIAMPGSDVDKVGQIILKAIGGRTMQQAIDAGGDNFNPFGLDADPLLTAAGVYFVSNDNSGAAIEQSEFSIYADYGTPGGLFLASALTPGVLPFAFNRGGKCFAGYVTGYPVGDKIYALDMNGRVCNAKTVEDAVNAQYHKISAETAKPADGGSSGDNSGGTNATTSSPSTNGPTGDDGGTGEEGAPASGDAGATANATADDKPFDGTTATDSDLQTNVYDAYVGAYRQALKHDNQFISDAFKYADLRAAVRDALEKSGYGATVVPSAPSASPDIARACATGGKIELRLAFKNDGVGISLAVVSDKRLAAYDYDPDKSSDLVITKPQDCGASAGQTPVPDKLSAPVH
jgi:hypothetical protein